MNAVNMGNMGYIANIENICYIGRAVDIERTGRTETDDQKEAGKASGRCGGNASCGDCEEGAVVVVDSADSADSADDEDILAVVDDDGC